MSLAQIGEFSFIIAGLGLSLDATRDFLYAIAVAVSAITTLTTPWLIRSADRVASAVDRILPRPLQTFAALYGAWVERLVAAPDPRSASAAVKRLLKLLLVDVALFVSLVIGVATSMRGITQYAALKLGLTDDVARLLVVSGAVVLAMPLLVGIFRMSHGLGMALADAALPTAPAGRADVAAAPRRALVVTLQLGVVLLVGLPVVALTQPFLPPWAAAGALGALLVVLGVAFWRSATNLETHVKAGAGMIVQALMNQARKGTSVSNGVSPNAAGDLMRALGEPLPVRVEEKSSAVGRTLGQLNLSGLTGASVLTIARGATAVVPAAAEVLRANDVLALAGTQEAVHAAAELLRGPAVEEPPRSLDMRRTD